jgi:hypothetical protein
LGCRPRTELRRSLSGSCGAAELRRSLSGKRGIYRCSELMWGVFAQACRQCMLRGLMGPRTGQHPKVFRTVALHNHLKTVPASPCHKAARGSRSECCQPMLVGFPALTTPTLPCPLGGGCRKQRRLGQGAASAVWWNQGGSECRQSTAGQCWEDSPGGPLWAGRSGVSGCWGPRAIGGSMASGIVCLACSLPAPSDGLQ